MASIVASSLSLHGVVSCRVIRRALRAARPRSARALSVRAAASDDAMPKYNFGSASEKAAWLNGVEAPGVPMKPGGKYNDPGSVPNDVVEAWAAFLKEQGVTRTICLLKQEELDCYAAPGYEAILRANGIEPALVDVFQAGSRDGILDAARAAKEAGEKVALHCSGGEGRTGLGLGAILADQCGMSVEEAAAEVVTHAGATGVTRKVKAEKLAGLMEKGTAA
jgi:protein-tyrosine phosphatase